MPHGGRSTERPRNIMGVVSLALLLAACASAPKESGETRMLESQANLEGVLTQPLNDFNLTRVEIPAELERLGTAPYGPPGGMSCGDLTREIVNLDRLVGPDIEGQTGSADKAIISEENAAKAARDAARDAASSWIPLRGIIRQLTGAERHAQALKEAILAGMVRRAYIKGLRDGQHCPILAMPAASVTNPAPPR